MHGGWNLTGGDDTVYPITICRWLGARGLHVNSVNYRLATVTRQGYPAQLQDVQLALRWVRSLQLSSSMA